MADRIRRGRALLIGRGAVLIKPSSVCEKLLGMLAAFIMEAEVYVTNAYFQIRAIGISYRAEIINCVLSNKLFSMWRVDIN
jgi:hypothetical protein